MNITKEDAVSRIAELRADIFKIETSEEYSMRSDAGDDSMWYQIEAIFDEIEMIKTEYGIE